MLVGAQMRFEFLAADRHTGMLPRQLRLHRSARVCHRNRVSAWHRADHWGYVRHRRRIRAGAGGAWP